MASAGHNPTGWLGYVYDAFAILVSIADITTDAWVTYYFHESGKQVPFYLALTILLLAQVSYVLAFELRFCHHLDEWELVCMFCVLLPMAPLLSFVIYFGSIPDTCVFKLMERIGFEMEDPSTDENAHMIEKFIVDKFVKHMGFLLEAGVEAFPQAILQMAVMVYYNETNTVAVASILLSLLSVCSKSLVFSYAIELRTFFFNWLSLVLDFIGIFTAIGWVFYNPNHGGGIRLLGYVWIAKVAFITVPMVSIPGFGVSFGCWLASCYQFFDNKNISNWIVRVPIALCFLAFWTCVFVVCTCFMCLLIEIACCSPIALLLTVYNASRFSASNGRAQFWGKSFSWLLSSDCRYDAVVRTCLFNEVLLGANEVTDSGLSNYLKEHRLNAYKNASFADMRKATNCRRKANALTRLWSDYNYIPNDTWNEVGRHNWHLTFTSWDDFGGTMAVIFGFPMIIVVFYFFAPLYFASRLFNFSFVWLCLIFTPWHQIAWLQLCMSMLFIALQFAWLVTGAFVVSMHYRVWHIAPGSNDLHGGNQFVASAWNVIEAMHDSMMLAPKRAEVVIDVMGPDLGKLIVSFLPDFVQDLRDADTFTSMLGSYNENHFS